MFLLSHWNKILFFLACLALAIFSKNADAGTVEMISARIHDDFESGEKSAWETYPFFQDMGFNPTLSCAHEPAHDGQFSLSQTFKPSDTDYPEDSNPVGLMKRLRLTTTEDSRLQIAVFISSDRRPKALEIGLCGEDGNHYKKIESSPEVNQWLSIDLGISDLQSGGASLHPGMSIEAITVVAAFEVVSPDRSYSVNIDSFSLSGERMKRFIPVAPQATWFEHFHMAALHQHYQPGDRLSISVRPEEAGDDPDILSVHCSVADPNGRIAVEDIELSDNGLPGDTRAGDGIWTQDNVYEITKSDPAGRWQICLKGKTAQGSTIETTYAFLVPSSTSQPAAHPRLFFSTQELTERAAQRGKSPLLQELFEEASAAARNTLKNESIEMHPEFSEVNSEFLGGGLFAPGWDQYDEWINGLRSSNLAEDCAFLYSMADDAAMGELGKDFLLHVCRFKSWNHPWMEAHGIHMYYPVGYTAGHVAVAFDLLYPTLTDEEKDTVRKALLDKAIIPAYRGEVLDNHIPSNISNHLGVSCTGALLAAVVLLGEDPGNPFLEPYLSGILAKFEAHLDTGYLRDGSYAEPFGYYHMDAEMTIKALAALSRNLGINWTTSKGIGDAWQYAVYTSTPTGRDCLDMGDGSGAWGRHAVKPLVWAAGQLRDGVAWDRFLWTRGKEIQYKIVADFYDFIWAPLDLAPVPVSTLAASKWFKARGFACFRSGWENQDLHLLYKAGPHSNHHHLDQGNLLLRYGGETLLDEGGLADYYINGYYHSFYEQAVAHNTVLVDWYPESQGLGDLRNQVKALDRYPSIIECTTGNIIDTLESELSSVYKGRLKQFNRSILFPKPDYIVLYDKMLPEKASSVQWLFHARSLDSIQTETRTCFINRPSASLRMEILHPHTFATRVKKHPDSDKGILMISSEKTGEELTFLSVLIPSMDQNKEERRGWAVESIDSPGWTGARIARGDGIDEICFRTQTEGDSTTGPYTTDADRLFATRGKDNSISRLWLSHATRFATTRQSGQPRLEVLMDQPATIALQWKDNALEIESDPEKGLILDLNGLAPPSRVWWNGAEQPFQFDKTTNRLEVRISAQKEQ